MQRIVQVLRIDAGRAQVFEALTQRDQLARWWTPRVEGGEDGLPLRFEFESDFAPEMQVIEARSPERVVWKCVGGAAHWAGDSFVFELREKGAGTVVKFVQECTNEVDEETFGFVNHNWGYYLNSLRLFCETGSGTPFESD